MEEVARSFPEVVQALERVPGSAVIDGELLAWRNNRALAFTVMQQRIARKKVSDTLIAEIPVVFMAYDLLYRDGRMLVDTPIEERRAQLESLMLPLGLPLLLSPKLTAVTHDDIDRLFLAARERGNEGLLLKRHGSIYEPWRRSGTWMKVKRPYGTLDVVVTAVH